MTLRLFDTRRLVELAQCIEGQVEALVGIGHEGIRLANRATDLGADGYEITMGSSRTRHCADRLSAGARDLRRLAQWLEEVEDRPGRQGIALPSLPSLGMLFWVSAFLNAWGGRNPVSQLIGVGTLTRLLPPNPSAYFDADMRRWLGDYGPGREYAYQCTAWANFRWRQLGYEGHSPIGRSGPDRPGNGKDMVQRACERTGLPVSTSPTLGAMASYDDGTEYGHVMVVEDIDPGPPTTITVSEGSSGNPSKWGNTSTWQHAGDQNWKRVPGGKTVTLTFAPHPGLAP